MRNERLAAEYSQALFKLAQEQKNEEEVYKDLSAMNALDGLGKRLLDLMRSPAVSLEEKKALIGRVFKGRKLSLHFLEMLIKRKAFHLLPLIAVRYKKLLDDASGLEHVAVYSAEELDKKKKDLLVARLENMLGKNVSARYSVDPGLIAGLVIRYRDRIFDGSLKTQFSTIKEELVRKQS